jgi:hypothetical protein
MNRPGGVTVSAVFLILGSLFTALIGVFMLFARSFVPPTTPQPPFLTAIMYAWAGMCFAFALWGVLSGVGLFRMRPWARLSTLVIGALLVIFFGFSMAILIFVKQQMSELRAAGSADTILGFVVAIYLIPILLGVWWLIYFNFGQVKKAFLEGVQVPTGPVRPLSITVIAWHLVAIAVLAPISLWLRFPAFVLGMVFTGWAAIVIYCFFAAAGLSIGVGLLRFKPWSLTAAIWFCYFGMLNSIVSALVPNAYANMLTAMKGMLPEVSASAGMMEPPPPLLNAAGGVLLMALPLFYLVTRKQAFLDAGRAAEAAK